MNAIEFRFAASNRGENCVVRRWVANLFAAKEDGRRIGRIRLRLIPDASADSLRRFILDSIAFGSVVHTDGWRGYSGLKAKGYVHQVTVLKGKKESASELLPRVHLVISLLKRWLMGTH